MREIKFRAWDKRIVGGWLLPDHLMLGIDGKFWWHDGAGRLVEATNDSLQFVHIMEYTGLKDETGKEIYEGDIWAYQEPWENKPNLEGTRRVVEYCNGFWNVAGTNLGIVVVIGNIWENPLEGK